MQASLCPHVLWSQCPWLLWGLRCHVFVISSTSCAAPLQALLSSSHHWPLVADIITILGFHCQSPLSQVAAVCDWTQQVALGWNRVWTPRQDFTCWFGKYNFRVNTTDFYSLLTWKSVQYGPVCSTLAIGLCPKILNHVNVKTCRIWYFSWSVLSVNSNIFKNMFIESSWKLRWKPESPANLLRAVNYVLQKLCMPGIYHSEIKDYKFEKQTERGKKQFDQVFRKRLCK